MTLRASRSLAVMSAVYRVQSVFRGHKARKASYRKREHDNWVALNFERSVMRSLVYVMLAMLTLFAIFINLIFGVKVRVAVARPAVHPSGVHMLCCLWSCWCCCWCCCCCCCCWWWWWWWWCCCCCFIKWPLFTAVCPRPGVLMS